MRRSGLLCRDPNTLVERNKKSTLRLYDNQASQVSWDPGWKFPISNRACRAARRLNQARNRTAGNTLLMRIASPAHVIRPLL